MLPRCSRPLHPGCRAAGALLRAAHVSTSKASTLRRFTGEALDPAAASALIHRNQYAGGTGDSIGVVYRTRHDTATNEHYERPRPGRRRAVLQVEAGDFSGRDLGGGVASGSQVCVAVEFAGLAGLRSAGAGFWRAARLTHAVRNSRPNYWVLSATVRLRLPLWSPPQGPATGLLARVP